ncbi:hypothetical protein [Streptomyces sp. HGB0020]|uniref:hypothetical protein n=1 Tax=Streptomyces sp. HGB0020 TaxID=1078086 RepID=UPI00034E0124|nr:hypothetical protein [Streptomyces sp. HGB0020]EPD63158.1 hypothetical protein HMPREF1211_03499 [Streptomyces sp. HGB0020]
MSTGELISEALQTLGVLVWAAFGWVILAVAAATVLILASIAGLGRLYRLVRPPRLPKE